MAGETSANDASPKSPTLKTLVLLAMGMFIEGYDSMALSQLLPTLRLEFGLDRSEAGRLLALAHVGPLFGFFLVRLADTWGRRLLLLVTISGYTLFTALSAFAPGVWVLGVLQLGARIFLTAEFAVAIVVAAEVFPAERRGLYIGIITACSTLGNIVCAGVVPLMLKSELGWRLVFLASLPGLLLVLWARRALPETPRFAALASTRARRSVGAALFGGLGEIWQSPYRRRVLQLGTLWVLAYAAGTSSVAFWKDHAVTDLGFSEERVGGIIVMAALGAAPLAFGTATLLDRIGRRRSAALIFGIGGVSVAACYSLSDPVLLTVALLFGIYSAAAYAQVLNAFTTELFPTELRGAAFAWCNNLFGRLSFSVTPLLVGAAAQGASWSTVLAPIGIAYFACAALIYAWLPETSGQELEQTSEI